MAAKPFRLTGGPTFLDPGWFNRTRNGIHPAAVSASGHGVVIVGVEFSLSEPLPPGTEMEAWLGMDGFFHAAVKSELVAERERKRQVEADQAAAAEAARQNRIRKTIADNLALSIPVKWATGIKDVLSGLQSGGWGDGRNRATVTHILLLEPLLAGRLRRNAGDFLCSSTPEDNGKRWSAQPAENLPGDHGVPEDAVTCKSCLRIAERFSRHEIQGEPAVENDPPSGVTAPSPKG